ncbi:hypothetical protein EDD36DRAFT_437212 [Exophiala viscosa]|uniref:NADP-dependent oxidoreductase domain-containing protein n=1 Tax=Exophiala viscosa TaxID=2486360 RepID=A0AAN6ICA2_9EURO|nr:hypothetical protein EDD36DRAFT_437212 [Exophiala viscosa]
MAGHCPTLFFGTATFGSFAIPTFTSPANVSDLLDAVKQLGITELDTAARYPYDNTGGSERILGEVQASSKGFSINTKVLLPEIWKD